MHRYALGCSTCCRSRLAGWKTAGEFEAARVEAGIGKRALRTARERLLADGAIEKGRDGFQGPYRYRRAERAAVAESLAPESEAAPGPVPEAPEIPERFAATLHALTVPAMAKDVPEGSAVLYALKTLAAGCGYKLRKEDWQSPCAPKMISLKLYPRVAPSDDPPLDRFLVKWALETLAKDYGYSLGRVSLTPLRGP